MPRKKSTVFYRNLLRDSWKITWQRKSLWFFGVFAAIMSTGGVMDVAVRSFKRIQSGPDFLTSVLDGTFPGYNYFAQYIEQFRYLDATRITITSGIAIILALLLIAAAVWSQGALISGIVSKKPIRIAAALQNSRSSFWHILFIDLLVKTTTTFLVLITTITLLTFMSQTDVVNAILYVIFFLIFFPLVIIVNIIATLAIVDTVKMKTHTLDAIHRATEMFAKHWLVTFELGVIIFLTVFAAGILGIVALLLLSVPFTILVVLSLLTASPFLFILMNFLTIITLFLLIFVFAGAAVTFQYSTWTHFYENASKKSTQSMVRSKIHRLWNP